MKNQEPLDNFIGGGWKKSICEYCNKPFFDFAKYHRKFCSPECYHRSRLTNYKMKCPECGETKEITSGSMEWVCKKCGRHWSKQASDIIPINIKQITIKRPEGLTCPCCGETKNIVSRGISWNCKSCKRVWTKKKYKRPIKKLSSFVDLQCPYCGEKNKIISEGPFWRCHSCGTSWQKRKRHTHTWTQNEHSKLKKYAKKTLENKGYSLFEFEVEIELDENQYRIDCVAKSPDGEKIFIECGSLEVDKLISLIKNYSVIWFGFNKEYYLFRKGSIRPT